MIANPTHHTNIFHIESAKNYIVLEEIYKKSCSDFSARLAPNVASVTGSIAGVSLSYLLVRSPLLAGAMGIASYVGASMLLPTTDMLMSKALMSDMIDNYPNLVLYLEEARKTNA